MKIKTRELLSALVLIEWGGVMIYLKASGRLSSFLHPNFHMLVLVTGVLLLLAAGCMLLVPGECDSVVHGGHEGHPHDDCGHDHNEALGVRAWLVFLVLLLPFGLAAWIAPNGYGAAKVRNSEQIQNVASIPSRSMARQVPDDGFSEPLPVKGAPPVSETQSSADSMPSPPPSSSAGTPPEGKPAPQHTPNANTALTTVDILAIHQNEVAIQQNVANNQTDMQPGADQTLQPDKNGNIPATVLDLFCAAYDTTGQKDYAGKPVVVIGQYMPLVTGETGDSRFNLTRLLMVCCAADARPVNVQVDIKNLHGFTKPKEMEWLEIVGKVVFEKHGDNMIAVVTADKATRTKAPEEAFLY